jgi:hypothetical protein
MPPEPAADRSVPAQSGAHRSPRPATTAANISQEVVVIPANDWAKREALRRLIREAEPTLKNAIVFCNRKRDVDVVAKSLVKHGFDAAPIHGDLDQSLRTKTLDRFRADELKILVASDVAARGSTFRRQPYSISTCLSMPTIMSIASAARAARAAALPTCWPRTATENISKPSRRSPTEAGAPRNDGHRGAKNPAPTADAMAGGKGGGRGVRKRPHHDRQRPGGKFHVHVASMEPVERR